LWFELSVTTLLFFFFQATAISDRPKAKPTKTQGKNNRKAYQPVQQQLQQSQQQQLGQHFHPFPYSHELPQQVLNGINHITGSLEAQCT
jgi:hypothetical protein